jgi:hypothetical protein
MVDFNNETTISTPSDKLVKCILIQEHFYLIESYKYYRLKKEQGANYPITFIRDKLLALFLLMEGMLRRRYKNKMDQFDKIKNACYDYKTETEFLEALSFFNIELDHLNITRVDNIQTYDRTNTEEENQAKGF